MVKSELVASMEIFSTNLQYLMKDKGVLPSELARGLSISPFRVDRWLSKKCYPKIEMMIQLCNYFDYQDIYKLLTTKID